MEQQDADTHNVQTYNAKTWFYKNKLDKIYGPFSDGQMRVYYRDKYIPGDVMIRRGGTKEDHTNGFEALNIIFVGDDLERAFLPGVGPCASVPHDNGEVDPNADQSTKSRQGSRMSGTGKKPSISKRKSVRLAELNKHFRPTDMTSLEKAKDKASPPAAANPKRTPIESIATNAPGPGRKISGEPSTATIASELIQQYKDYMQSHHIRVGDLYKRHAAEQKNILRSFLTRTLKSADPGMGKKKTSGSDISKERGQTTQDIATIINEHGRIIAETSAQYETLRKDKPPERYVLGFLDKPGKFNSFNYYERWVEVRDAGTPRVHLTIAKSESDHTKQLFPISETSVVRTLPLKSRIGKQPEETLTFELLSGKKRSIKLRAKTKDDLDDFVEIIESEISKLKKAANNETINPLMDAAVGPARTPSLKPQLSSGNLLSDVQLEHVPSLHTVQENDEALGPSNIEIGSSDSLFGTKRQHAHEYYSVDGVFGTFDWKLGASDASADVEKFTAFTMELLKYVRRIHGEIITFVCSNINSNKSGKVISSWVVLFATLSSMQSFFLDSIVKSLLLTLKDSFKAECTFTYFYPKSIKDTVMEPTYLPMRRGKCANNFKQLTRLPIYPTAHSLIVEYIFDIETAKKFSSFCRFEKSFTNDLREYCSSELLFFHSSHSKNSNKIIWTFIFASTTAFVTLFEQDTTKTDILQQCIRCCTSVSGFVLHQMTCPESTKIVTSQHEKGINLTYVPHVPGSFALNPGATLFDSVEGSAENPQLWGAAMKLGNFFKTWQKRYFCYQKAENTILYFENVPSSERRESERGTIKLDKGATVLQLDRIYDIGIEIITQKRKYYLMFETVGERNLWTRALQSSVCKTINAAGETIERDELHDYCTHVSPGTHQFSETLEILHFCIEAYGENHIVISLTAYTGNSGIISWDVTRKYSEFADLRNRVARLRVSETSSEQFGMYLVRSLPPYYKLKDNLDVNAFEEQLEDFLQIILSMPKIRKTELLQKFLNTSTPTLAAGSRDTGSRRFRNSISLKDSFGRRVRSSSVEVEDDTFFMKQMEFASMDTPERNKLLKHTLLSGQKRTVARKG